MEDAMKRDPRMQVPSIQMEPRQSVSLWGPYPTTLVIILLLHILYVLHWNTKRTKRQLLVSYQQLLQRKQFHLAIRAILSHPPVEPLLHGGANDHVVSSSPSLLAVDMGHAVDPHNNNNNNYTSWKERMHQRLKPLIQGHLSGLPLLLYNSHILWSCRALEPALTNFNDPPDDRTEEKKDYLYSILSWAALSLLLELLLSHRLLLTLKRRFGIIGSNSNDFGSIQPEYSTLPNARRVVLHRGMGSLTGLTAAVLWIFHQSFPYVQLEPLPGLSIPLFVPLSYSLCLSILTVLSWRIHPVTPVFCGTVTGILWSAGLIRFLGNVYWGRCLVLWGTALCALSLKHTTLDIPCIDYVSWDHRGRILTDNDNDYYHHDEDDNDNDDDEEEGDEYRYNGEDNSIVGDLENPEPRGQPIPDPADSDSNSSRSRHRRPSSSRGDGSLR